MSALALASLSLLALHLHFRPCDALPLPHPSSPERAERPASSPVGIVVDAKENFGFLIQRPIIKALDPKPIVDTMSEAEKYGNTQQHEIGRRLVKIVEGVSNAVNKGFSVPQEVAKAGSRKLTEVLDNFGGKLVGLQK